MADAAESGPGEHRLHVVADVLAAIALSVAALLSTWASYQAALWDGEQAAAYTRAGAARVESGLLATENGQAEGIDLFLFSQWLDAFADGNVRLQHFYRARFRPEFATAFDAWLALRPQHDPRAPPSPFAMRQYKPHLKVQAAAMGRQADQLFADGQRANAISDSFVQATVLLALALFLGGIGQTFRRLTLKLMVTVLAACACAAGIVRLVALPILQPG